MLESIFRSQIATGDLLVGCINHNLKIGLVPIYNGDHIPKSPTPCLKG